MRAWIPRSTVALGATLLSLVGAELWARGQEGTVVFPWDQPGRGFATRPRTRGSNAWGFHERNIAPGREPSARRVVVLGDSLTWGTGKAEQTWTRAAEDALGPPWQVLNFGHYGYDGEACAATLRYVASQWSPDVVVYASYTNDLLRNTIINTGSFGYPVWIGSQPTPLPRPLRQTSALLRAFEGVWLARGLVQRPDPDFYRAQVADMAEQSHALGASFVVFGLVPHVFAGDTCEADAAFCDWHRASVEVQEATVRAMGIPWIPVEPMLDATGAESFYPLDSGDHDHPDPAGHQVMGRGFAAALSAALGPASPGGAR